MSEDLPALVRAGLEAGLADERPPPLGDIVAVAIRKGRRIRRRRRLGVVSAAVLVVAALVLAHTLTVGSGTQRADGMQKKATSAGMLHLLTMLLPPGRTSHYAVAADDDLHVQVYVDNGEGPAVVGVRLTGPPATERHGSATMTVTHTPGDCLRDTATTAAWPDGTRVEVDVATCLRPGGPFTHPALTEKQAAAIAADPRWGASMDAQLVEQGAAQFPGGVPVLS